MWADLITRATPPQAEMFSQAGRARRGLPALPPELLSRSLRPWELMRGRRYPVIS
jgi:hypothetical protein